MPFHLLKNEPIASGLRRIASEQIEYALDNLADETIPSHRKVHLLRTRCKKLRGLLRLPRPIMGDAFEREDQRFRSAAKQLAGNRDLAVCAKTIAALTGSKEKPVLTQQPGAEPNMEQFRQLLMRVPLTVEALPVDMHGFHDLAPGFARTYRKCLEAWENVMREQCDEHFHRLRRMGKYHWYHVRILERLNKQELRKRRKRLRKLHLTLGAAHDLVILQAFLEQRDDPDTQLQERAMERKLELYANAIEIGNSLFAVSVSDLIADCARYWADRQRALESE